MVNKIFEVDFSIPCRELAKFYNNPLRRLLDNRTKPKTIEKYLGTKYKETPPNWHSQENHRTIVCFDYALGLCDSTDYLESLKEEKGFQVDSYFMKYLIDEKVLKPLNAPEKNCIVLYSKRTCGLVFAPEFQDIPLGFPSDDHPKNFVVLINKPSISEVFFIKNSKLMKDEEKKPIKKLIKTSVRSVISLSRQWDVYSANKNRKEVKNLILDSVSMAGLSIDPHPTHAGIIVDPDLLTVESKWGKISAIFQHEILKVPKSYGFEKPRYYTRPTSCEEIYKILIDYHNRKKEDRFKYFSPILRDRLWQ